MDDTNIDVSNYNDETNFASELDRELTNIVKWFGFTISILGLLVIIILLIQKIYYCNKRKKLLVEGELSNYLHSDATSEGERTSELATNIV